MDDGGLVYSHKMVEVDVCLFSSDEVVAVKETVVHCGCGFGHSLHLPCKAIVYWDIWGKIKGHTTHDE